MSAAGKNAGRAPLTDADRFEQRRKSGIAKSAERRSRNARPRTIDEVRATVHDAAQQLERYAKRNGRPDFAVLAGIVRRVRQAMTMEPWQGAELVEWLHNLEMVAYDFRSDVCGRLDGTPDPREYDAPWMHVAVTHDGLQQIQQAVADRIRTGRLPAEPPAAPTPGGTIDFAAAAQRVRERRAHERRREP